MIFPLVTESARLYRSFALEMRHWLVRRARVLFLSGLCLAFAGCAATNHDTSYSLAVSGTAWEQASAAGQWPDTSALAPVSGKQSNVFEDTNISAEWHLWDWNMKLKLSNKGPTPLTVLWPEARVAWAVKEDALHNKEMREPRNTSLAPAKSVTYSAYPLSPLNWMGPLDEKKGFWSNMGASAPIFGLSFFPDQSPEARQRRARQAAGHHVNVLLPMQFSGQRVNYVFRLHIKDARNYGVYY